MTPITEDEAREILGVSAATPYVSVTAQGIIIASGYSEALARLLRWVPKASWRQDKRAWLVPLAGADAVRSVLPEIIRLAEAADDERAQERAASPNAAAAFGTEWLAGLNQAAKRASEEIAAMTGSPPPQSLNRDAFAKIVTTLRSEASKLTEAAELLEAWLKGSSGDDQIVR